MSSSLSEHLPLLASTPDGIKKLRGLILELAVRGKLVEQDPDDEPASELLKRIAKDRALFESEGACRRLKRMPPVGEDERPFTLPDGPQGAQPQSQWDEVEQSRHLMLTMGMVSPNAVVGSWPSHLSIQAR